MKKKKLKQKNTYTIYTSNGKILIEAYSTDEANDIAKKLNL